MATEALNVSLPEQLRGFVDAQVSSGSYGSASEFIRELLRNEQRRLAKDNLTAFIQAGLDSGDVQAWTPERFDSLRQSLRESSAAKKVKPVDRLKPHLSTQNRCLRMHAAPGCFAQLVCEPQHSELADVALSFSLQTNLGNQLRLRRPNYGQTLQRPLQSLSLHQV